jgi:serine/threonine protein phosphatase PrpC
VAAVKRKQTDGSKMTLAWQSSCGTDVGRVRSLNEDAFLERPELGLWLVADGMGGHSAGDIASRIIIESFGDLLAPCSLGELSVLVKSKLGNANRQIQEKIGQEPEISVMGSTVVALITDGSECCCLWAGDSRAYLFRDNQLTQMTRDHSLVEDLIAAGEIAREDAENHPQANVITRAVGTGQELHLEEKCYGLIEGDKILLCSDGLNKELLDDDIADILTQFDYQEAMKTLLATTLERGGRDNVTVAIVEFPYEEDPTVNLC